MCIIKPIHSFLTDSGVNIASCPVATERSLTGCEADNSAVYSAEVEKLELYLYSPIRVRGRVLNYINGGTTLAFPYPHYAKDIPVVNTGLSVSNLSEI
jgi:hypothetical protein